MLQGICLLAERSIPIGKMFWGIYRMITFQMLKHRHRLKSAGVELCRCFVASSQVGVKGDKVWSFVWAEREMASPQRICHYTIPSPPFCCFWGIEMLLAVWGYLPVIRTSLFPFTTSFAKNVGRFTVLLQQLCSTWLAVPSFLLDIKFASKHLAFSGALRIFSVFVYHGAVTWCWKLNPQEVCIVL